jgi:transcriptional regulator with GAF, ATPase, and Fis domain
MAQSASSVLITGETGTGKEMFAQAIHNSSPRRDFPFVAVNCGALPESLLESELFGYEEGAFTGARRGGKPGLFELAHRGTLFLDEIGEMPPSLQMRLLRVLEERQVMRLGGAGLRGIDIRVIAASNRNLERMVAEGGFREDLYYRLAVLPLPIPPLRDRIEDILPLVREFQRLLGVAFCFEPEVESFLLQREWRGNARELRNCIEYVANLGIPRVGLADLPEPLLVQGRRQTPGTEGASERGLERADGKAESDSGLAPGSKEDATREPVSFTHGSRAGAARNLGTPGYASSTDTRDGDAGQDASVHSMDAVAATDSDTAGRLRDDRSLRAFLISRINAARQAGARLGRRGLTAEARRIGLYVSERSVREALLELEREGIVEILPGRGGTIPRTIPAER